MFELNGKKVVVVGLGKSGDAAARFCLKKGARVAALDSRPEVELAGLAKSLRAAGARVVCGPHRKKDFAGADLVVVSPGVPGTIAPIRSAAEAGALVAGEVELASWFISEPVVAVTGTNGKTTVTTLLGEMLKEAGLQVFVGGNIGTPLISYADSDNRAEVVVAEISSFQLDTAPTFTPRVGVL
ncbi:MAG: UDP-N-acetylmuramoyl-L-alanine--D-glutamate ligase, partial [Deltaproteobacteria bacterium]|nr:UDP-N-acetylmuramoyl-L-alanine--D-glutamate ligase [Deltaproteobacteria bacterium]